MRRTRLTAGLFATALCAGCASDPQLAQNAPPLAAPGHAVVAPRIPTGHHSPVPATVATEVQAVSHDEIHFAPKPAVTNGTLTIDGRQYKIQLVAEEDGAEVDDSKVVKADHALVPLQTGELMSDGVFESELSAPVIDAPMDQTNVLHLNLPSTLAMIDRTHPAVGLAQWRVQEAYAKLDSAEALWLPSIQSGLSFHRHDGNYQASNGEIVDVNRNSLQYGLGTGAVGAGTTPRPGLVAQFHLADAIFQPEIAQKDAWAKGHAAKAVLNRQMLIAATAYLKLLSGHQDVQILEQSRSRLSELAKITTDFAEAGEGLRSDADRMETELALVDNRIIAARESIAVASARLAQAVSMESEAQVLPTDLTVVPLELETSLQDKSSLIQQGLSARPELKESQALVAAACEAYQREKYAPFVPSVLLGFSTGGFGGGVGPDPENFDSRYDFDASMSWQIRNLGLGEKSARRETAARIQKAKYEKLVIMDQVAREVSEAYSQVQFRREQIAATQRAVASADTSYELNLSRIRDGQGLPLEVLQSVQAMEAAKRAYLNAVIDHNEAQLRLQWAQGWPIDTNSL